MKKLVLIAASLLFSLSTMAEICEGFGPQTPRDLTSKLGTNSVMFSKAPKKANMNLCNIHFHKNAEHKAKGFSIPAGKEKHGGWKCNETPKLKSTELAQTFAPICQNLQTGDTVEVHWVYSSCDVDPGKGLGSCLSDSCPNPQLRVETKVFVLVSGDTGSNFADYTELTEKNGYNQVVRGPKMNKRAEFLGSTTGPKYTQKTCSPLHVTWNVSQACEKLDIMTLGKWCKGNKFEEDHAHGVRQIVTNPKLLSKIR